MATTSASGGAFPSVSRLSDLAATCGDGWAATPDSCIALDSDLREVMGQVTTELMSALAPPGPNAAGPTSNETYALHRSLSPAWAATTALQVKLRYHSASVRLANEPDGVWETTAPVKAHSLRDAVESALVDVEALCNEKHGVVPAVTIVGDSAERTAVVCDRGHLRFVLLELLKNAFAATISRYGIDADEAPPISVAIGPDPLHAGLQITDSGNGIPGRVAARCFDFFFTTVPYVEPTYTFSGSFGGEMEGRGVGLPLARAITTAYGGSLTLGSTVGYGTTAFVSLPQDATV